MIGGEEYGCECIKIAATEEYQTERKIWREETLRAIVTDMVGDYQRKTQVGRNQSLIALLETHSGPEWMIEELRIGVDPKSWSIREKVDLYHWFGRLAGPHGTDLYNQNWERIKGMIEEDHDDFEHFVRSLKSVTPERPLSTDHLQSEKTSQEEVQSEVTTSASTEETEGHTPSQEPNHTFFKKALRTTIVKGISLISSVVKKTFGK